MPAGEDRDVLDAFIGEWSDVHSTYNQHIQYSEDSLALDYMNADIREVRKSTSLLQASCIDSRKVLGLSLDAYGEEELKDVE